MKSQLEEVLLMYWHLFVDAGNTFPDLRDEFRKDYETLAALADERGLHLFCVDLPHVGKHLDRCVSEERFMVCGLPLTKRCPKRIMYPEFLKGLWGLVFSECGRLKESCDVEALLFLRQFYYMAKKLKLDCPREAVLQEVQTFMDVDSELPSPEDEWYDTGTSVSEAYEGFFRSNRYQTRCVQRGQVIDRALDVCPGTAATLFIDSLIRLDTIASFISSALGDYNPSEWSFKHGPGVVSERKGEFNKYEFVNWSPMLESVFALADFGYHNHQSWARQVLSSKLTEEIPESKMIAVPKTLSGPRLIAAEPSEHMWCQQNIWSYIKGRVECSWIADFVRFTDQSRNQTLCKASSLTGSLATLDLSSASDRVSCHFVGQLFRSNPRFLEALRATRTQSIRQDINPEVSHRRRLNKFSTMGSACTFPVETLGFLAVALAVCLTKRRLPVTLANIRGLREEVTIFGDDIIVPTDCRELVCNVLEILDFKVNTSKSFWNGKFRESCGVDAYRGVDVTPVYWRALQKSDPESVVGTVEVRNSFYKRGYWAVAEYLTSTIQREGLPVVRTDSGVFGLATFGKAQLRGLRRRINVFLQRDEVFCLGYTTKRKIREINDESVLLQFFTENPEPHQPWAGGVALRPKGRLAFGWFPTHDVVS